MLGLPAWSLSSSPEPWEWARVSHCRGQSCEVTGTSRCEPGFPFLPGSSGTCVLDSDPLVVGHRLLHTLSPCSSAFRLGKGSGSLGFPCGLGFFAGLASFHLAPSLQGLRLVKNGSPN